MSTTPPASLLVDLPDSVLWSSRGWSDFAAMPPAARPLALLPVFGFADWGLGRPLDIEETLGCGVLRAMFASDPAHAARVAVLPPLRFVLGPYPHTLFGIDFETALDLVREIGTSVAAAGIDRLVFLNTSPWNEEFIETCACDLRADVGLQTFAIHLEALGLDLHPARSTTRSSVQAAACTLTRRAPSGDAPRADARLVDFRPGDHRQPAPLAWSTSLDVAVGEGATILAGAGVRLARLIAEIEAHPSLAHDRLIQGPHAPAPSPRRAACAKPPARKKGRRTR